MKSTRNTVFGISFLTTACVLTLTLGLAAEAQDTTSFGTKAVVRTAYDNFPLSFEANQGQSDAPVKFLSPGRGYHVALAPTETVITLRSLGGSGEAEKRGNKERGKEARSTPQSASRNLQTTVLRLQLVGANPQATVSGVDELPGRVNYITGQDQTKWRTNIPTYAKVHYENVYPGVDLVYYGNDQRRLEYDFHVAAGADPKTIRLKFVGVERLDVDSAGDLILHTTGGEIRQHRPQIYQEAAGIRQSISGGYVMTGAYEVGFAIDNYDPLRSLIIDPEIVYSTFLGGVSGDPYSHIDKDAGHDITVDAAGNIYVVGETNSLGRYDSDVFVRKFNPSGSQLLYETHLDSNGSNDIGNGIAVDAAGNAYVTGQFGDPLLPGWALGVLVAKLSPAGAPLYQVTFGADSPGYSQDFGARIAADEAGNAYVVGTTYNYGTPFPTTPGAFQSSFAGGLEDAFVVKLNPSGGFVYSTLLGSTGDDEGWGIAIRKVGGVYHAYVTGTTALANDFPTTPGALQTRFGGAADVFVTQLNDTGSALVYSTYLGGNGLDKGLAIAVDAPGNAYLTGLTGKEPLDAVSHFPIINAFQPIYGGEGGATPAAANAFVAKLNPAGSALVYSSYMGGGGYELYDAGLAIKVDGAGYAYLTGVTGTRPDIFTGASFPIVNAFQLEPGGGFSSSYDDAFVAKLTPQGALVYSSYLGGIYGDEGHGIAVGASGNVYVTGVTNSEDFPITLGAFQSQISGGGCSYTFQCPDAFVTKIADGLMLTVTKQGTGSGTVTSSPAGISCGADCSESYPSGAVVTLSATPTAGSAFTGWSGDTGCTTATQGVTMNANKTCTATFTLLPPTLTSPNGGETWPIGSTQTIRWTSSGVTGNVTIELSRNGGATWTALVANTPNDGNQSWVVTGPATPQALMRIFSVSTPTLRDTSDRAFALGGGSITVQAPNGGEVWPIGSTQTIRWTSSGVTGNVTIELSRNGGATWTALIANTPNDGNQSWVVTGPATSQARIRVKSVLDAGAIDTSDSNFTLGGGKITVLAPDGGESWAINTTQVLRWSATGITGNVKIELSRNGGVTWGVLFGSTVNDGVENWVVSGPATSQARIRVSSLLDAGAADTSNGNATIY